jgi:hypothetical protein
LYATAGYTIAFISYFASYSATVMHALLFNHRQMLDAIQNTFQPKRRKEQITDIHFKLISKYPEVPQWWYVVVFLISFVLAFVGLLIYVPEAPKWVSQVPY